MAWQRHGFNLLYFQNRGLPDGSGPLPHRNLTSPHAGGPFSLPATVLSRSDCGWTEVSLSLRMCRRLKCNQHLFVARYWSLAPYLHPIHNGMDTSAIIRLMPDRWSWRTCNLASLFRAIRGTCRKDTYSLIKDREGKAVLPSRPIHW